MMLLPAFADHGSGLSHLTLLLCLGRTLVGELLVRLLLLEVSLRDLDVLVGDAVGAALQALLLATIDTVELLNVR
jgi:hypothetical protein